MKVSVWAPRAHRVRVDVEDRTIPMTSDPSGWWTAELADLPDGTRYGFLLDDDDTPLPDPRSRWQPEGVHGPSRLHDTQAYEWRDADWTGRQLAGGVVYELHVGTFTPEGTFA